MPELFPDFFILLAASFLAGLIDAVVWGGRLVQIPALFEMLPNTAPATIFVTRPVAVNFARPVKLASSAALPAPGAALLFAFLGAYTIKHIPTEAIRKSLPFIFLGVADIHDEEKGF